MPGECPANAQPLPECGRRDSALGVAGREGAGISTQCLKTRIAQVVNAPRRDHGRPTPAIMPVTGASGAANLPTTLLIGAFAFVLVVGGNNFLQRLRSK